MPSDRHCVGPARGGGLAVWLASVGLCMGQGSSARAEELPQLRQQAPVLEASELPPSAEDVARIIKELASVRDYERLSWVLAAIERQVPPVRAELLRALDDHVQQLLQAEVEARTATALASVQPLLNPQANGSEAAAEPTPVPPHRGVRDQEDSAQGRAPWQTPKAYREVKGVIEHTQFAAEPAQRMQQTQELMNAVFGVEDSQQRQELRQLVLERSKQAQTDHLDALRASIIADLTRPVAPGNPASDVK